MTITKIQPKKKYLCDIFLDFEHSFELDRRIAEENALYEGQDIDEEKLRSLIEASKELRAKEKALWLLSFRDHSKKELFYKLSKDYSEDICENLLCHLEELGLVDDEKFARKYAENLFNVKMLSEKCVISKLLQKGIDRTLAKDVASELSPDSEDQLSSLLDRKYSRYMFDEKGRKKVFSSLLRSGYGYRDIKSAFLRFDEENGCDGIEEEWYE